jgi:pimeloyl-ACP methyl ester carboxylesterase
MAFLRWLGRFALVLFVLLNVVLAFHAYRFTYFYETRDVPWRRPEDIPTGERITQALTGFRFGKRPVTDFPEKPFRTVWLKNERGQRLEAWYTEATRPGGTVLLFHGHGSCKGKLIAEQTYFRRLGYNTLAVDFRAHGNSEGNVCTIGYHEVGDVRAAYDFVRKTGERNIVLWGVSMGAAAILKALHDFPDLHPSRVLLECPFGSLQAGVDGRMRSMHLPTTPFTELLLLWGSAERGMWGFGFRPTEYARTVRCPTLLLWGARDNRVLRPETDAIFANLAAPEKKLVIFDQSGHQSFCQNEPDKWQTELARFLGVPEPVVAGRRGGDVPPLAADQRAGLNH